MPPNPLENPLASPPSKPRITDTLAFIQNQLGEKDAAQAKKLLGEQSEKPTDAREENWGDEEEPQDLNVSDEEKQSIEAQKVFQEIISRESLALQKFFGRSFEIPPLPKEATPERIKEWHSEGFALHYLPPVSMAEIKRDPAGKILEVIPMEFPGWKKKPGKEYTPGKQWGIEFFNEVKNGNLDPSVLHLKGGWLLCDTRERPPYDNGKQMYADDPLSPALEELRKKKLIQDHEVKGSRFNLSPRELANPAVRQALKEALPFGDIPGIEIDLPRAIEFNMIGNIHDPHLGNANTSEWFGDSHRAGSLRLYGGGSVSGGLSYVDSGGLGDRSVYVGFRLLGRFSQAEAEPPRT